MRKARDRWIPTFTAILLVPLLVGTTCRWADPLPQLEVLAGDWIAASGRPRNERLQA